MERKARPGVSAGGARSKPGTYKIIEVYGEFFRCEIQQLDYKIGAAAYMRIKTGERVKQQRSHLERVKIRSCGFTDFEAIESRLENCIIMNSRFVITCGGGMNGYSGAHIKNCLFYNCRFEGFPLRGARVEGCAFVLCGGEPGDDMQCVNTAGLGSRGNIRPVRLPRREEAAGVLARFA